MLRTSLEEDLVSACMKPWIKLDAFIGPLLFAAVMAATGSYKVGFSIMWIPAIMTTMMVLYTRSKVPDPEALESSKPVNTTDGSDNDSLSKAYWYYAAFTFISFIGFINFPILSYHFAKNKILSEALIPALYAVAMALDGIGVEVTFSFEAMIRKAPKFKLVLDSKHIFIL